MTEISSIILALAGGVLLGTIFFAGLWFTVKKAVASKIPALWIFCSFFFRLSIALTGLYFIGAGNWQRLLACMIGFIAARFIVIHYTKSIDEKAMLVKKEANYET
ncbi:MAG: ATP synthase subunit I [Chitinophagaceae bacterium]